MMHVRSRLNLRSAKRLGHVNERHETVEHVGGEVRVLAAVGTVRVPLLRGRARKAHHAAEVLQTRLPAKDLLHDGQPGRAFKAGEIFHTERHIIAASVAQLEIVEAARLEQVQLVAIRDALECRVKQFADFLFDSEHVVQTQREGGVGQAAETVAVERHGGGIRGGLERAVPWADNTLVIAHISDGKVHTLGTVAAMRLNAKSCDDAPFRPLRRSAA